MGRHSGQQLVKSDEVEVGRDASYPLLAHRHDPGVLVDVRSAVARSGSAPPQGHHCVTVGVEGMHVGLDLAFEPRHDRPGPVPQEFRAAGVRRRFGGARHGPVHVVGEDGIEAVLASDAEFEGVAHQLGVALADEVHDLEEAGIDIIQIDEPALRELLPLREEDRKAYLDWAVRSFRLVALEAKPTTQIHTHLCYSEFGQIIDAVAGLDADVTSIEAARSRMELLEDIDETFHSEIGPGIYDIHSPRVPSVAEMAELIRAALKHVPVERLWVNPDCGLKTRGYEETEASLRNMVLARDEVRDSL